MSFGFGVGDFITVIQLAWDVYQGCKAAPDSFGNIANDALSLYAVLKEADEALTPQTLPADRKDHLNTILARCNGVLTETQAMVTKYQSLGTQQKRMWDRWTFKPEDAAELRLRLTAHVTMLNTFISTHSWLRIEQKLDRLAKEYQAGKRGGSIMSVQTIDSLDPDDRQLWRKIRKELEGIGITIAAFEANRTFILQWLSEAVKSGSFVEQEPSYVPPGDSNILTTASIDEQSAEHTQQSDFEVNNTKDQIAFGDSIQNPLGESNESSQSSKVETSGAIATTANASAQPMPNATTLTASASRPRLSQSQNRIPRLPLLLARLSRPKKDFNAALDKWDLSKITGILNHEIKFSILSKADLYRGLLLAIRKDDLETARLLLESGAPLESGGGKILEEVNGRQFNSVGAETALHYAAQFGTPEMVTYILAQGFMVDHKLSKGPFKGATALSLAAEYRQTRVIDMLLHHRANPNSVDEIRRTPLHYAVLEFNSREDEAAYVVSSLINHGANIDCHNDWGFYGETPLRMAVQGRFCKATKILIEAGADVKDLTRSGEDPILTRLLAREEVDYDLYKMLIESGQIEINAVDGNGKTALHYFACLPAEISRISINGLGELILNAGARVDVKDIMGNTPLFYAAQRVTIHKSNGCYELLVAHGANERVLDAFGDSAQNERLRMLSIANLRPQR